LAIARREPPFHDVADGGSGAAIVARDARQRLAVAISHPDLRPLRMRYFALFSRIAHFRFFSFHPCARRARSFFFSNVLPVSREKECATDRDIHLVYGAMPD